MKPLYIALLATLSLTSTLIAKAQDTASQAQSQQADDDRTFTKVEIEAAFPGGSPAWLRYLTKNLNYPREAVKNKIEGTVIVQFIVDKEGRVSDVQAIMGPETGGLREEAVRVIKNCGRWMPAIQNGRQVKSYKKQPVVFKLHL